MFFPGYDQSKVLDQEHFLRESRTLTGRRWGSVMTLVSVAGSLARLAA